jgi:hypothetical protein
VALARRRQGVCLSALAAMSFLTSCSGLIPLVCEMAWRGCCSLGVSPPYPGGWWGVSDVRCERGCGRCGGHGPCCALRGDVTACGWRFFVACDDVHGMNSWKGADAADHSALVRGAARCSELEEEIQVVLRHKATAVGPDWSGAGQER